MAQVYKFGGTSVDKLDQIVRVIRERYTYDIYVCVSAFSGLTDYLIKIVDSAVNKKAFSKEDKEYIQEFHMKKIELGLANLDTVRFLQSKWTKFYKLQLPVLEKAYNSLKRRGYKDTVSHDIIIGFGEQASAYLLSELVTHEFSKEKITGVYIDLAEVIKSKYRRANKSFCNELKNKVAKRIAGKKKNLVYIITGIIGRIPEGILYSIDRGYTDYTGALVSAVLNAETYIIFKEVDGVCTGDPRVLKEKCLLLKELSYTEVLKMASAGMKAINVHAVKPAMQAKIPIEVRNTETPNKQGTVILSSRKFDPKSKIQNIACKKGVCIVRYGGYPDKPEDLELILIKALLKFKLKKFFSISDDAGTSVVLPYDPIKIEKLKKYLQKFGVVKFNPNCAIVALIGEEMHNTVGVTAAASAAITKTGASIYSIAQGASEVGLDFVIDAKYADEAVANIHECFFNS